MKIKTPATAPATATATATTATAPAPAPATATATATTATATATATATTATATAPATATATTATATAGKLYKTGCACLRTYKNMKQHITIEQLNELSVLDQKVLEFWWTGYLVTEPSELWDAGIQHPTHNGLPLLSIGQMIEFLKGSNITYAVYMDLLVVRDANEPRILPYEGHEWHITYKELCDALWKVIKEILHAK
jgi:hypothetical protein